MSQVHESPSVSHDDIGPNLIDMDALLLDLRDLVTTLGDPKATKKVRLFMAINLDQPIKRSDQAIICKAAEALDSSNKL